MSTHIEWTEETWNPIVGCSKCSPGCDHCYAERMANRLSGIALAKNATPDVTRGIGRYIAVINPGGEWNGSTCCDNSEDISGEFFKPLRMKKARRIFVSSMGDLFHEKNPDIWINIVVGVQKRAHQHTYIWLTKRPEQMRDFILGYFKGDSPGKNVWCGVTVCTQDEADSKIPVLLETPATVRFVSIEPMLGSVDISKYMPSGDGFVSSRRGMEATSNSPTTGIIYRRWSFSFF